MDRSRAVYFTQEEQIVIMNYEELKNLITQLHIIRLGRHAGKK